MDYFSLRVFVGNGRVGLGTKNQNVMRPVYCTDLTYGKDGRIRLGISKESDV